jgi:hypothetical protein
MRQRWVMRQSQALQLGKPIDWASHFLLCPSQVWHLGLDDRNLPVLVGVFGLLLLPILLGGFHIAFWMMVFLTLLLRFVGSRPMFLLST